MHIYGNQSRDDQIVGAHDPSDMEKNYDDYAIRVFAMREWRRRNREWNARGDKSIAR